ncbi:MAG: porphobilinogen synthase [Elusimicrobia bacterium]|nr:porphobilinogen synthase [Elusimicrobiota bacterium]
MRLRRWRRTAALRAIMTQTRLQREELMAPFFIREENTSQIVSKLPNHPQHNLHDLLKAIEKFTHSGGKSIILFGIPKSKDSLATGAHGFNGIIQRALREIKKTFSHDIAVAADLCLCEYTDHGHCGILKRIAHRASRVARSKNSAPFSSNSKRATRNAQLFTIDNDATLDILRKTAVSLAHAGADIIAPSGMMDGQVTAIRESLDENNFKDTLILSYAAKYASTLYGPFRELAESKPSFGDRKSYQMNPANSDEALREIALDIQEGADIVMVKPAMFYLDAIERAKSTFNWPLAAFQVSGEAWMIEQYAQSGMARREDAILESTLAIKRAGANLIITYFAQELLGLL